MLSVIDAVVRFGPLTALDGADLTVGNETLAVLGPSGSGKSTLLRVIAGLEPMDRGRVILGGRDLTAVPVHQRGVGLMFQDYALFPHRDVAGNVGFGLEMQGLDHDERTHRVDEVLELVGLAGFGHRPVEHLSGGEAQRVALARTLAPRPGVILLDEPLGALDRMLRARLVDDIRDVLDTAGTPAVYVTHDHGEAEAVADRVAIMRSGRIVQTGTLDEIRAAPADGWTREFVAI